MTPTGGPGERECWLLDVEGDERAGCRDTPDARRARSVRSGRILQRVVEEEAPGGGSGDDRDR
ncbi:hypothetical protein [Streptomyces sp. G7(2002)]|uniref:hypothetical protein n=1 Tax=Streptomyces sp. G7(2002) TaxID=2971798 RepID=UPI00237D4CAA|nr:hypothetical protein [Streptomyces sp. G7(2002)]WDT58487.1 hypothetical protein NUT86_33120 [Streptomyces sp. G7(2002)]